MLCACETKRKYAGIKSTQMGNVIYQVERVI